MRALAAVLALAGCGPVTPMLTPVEGRIPTALRGLWAETPAECGATAAVRVGAETLANGVETCRVRGLAPAASGGVLADVACAGPAGARNDLVRLARIGNALSYRSIDGAVILEACP